MSQAGKYSDGTILKDLETLTGNVGGPVPADTNYNINIVGVDPITVTGTPGINTLTITVEAATDVQIGVVTLATQAEAITGVDDTKVVTPFGLRGKLGAQTQYAVPYGDGNTNALQWAGPGEDGEVLIGATGAAPEWMNIEAGANVTIQNLPNRIIISASGGGGGSGATTFPCDTGVSTEIGGFLEILGDGINITTLGAPGSGADNFVRIILEDTVTIPDDFITTSGSIYLPITSTDLSEGVVYIDNKRFMHAGGIISNTWVGSQSGNGTTTGAQNTGVGAFAGTTLTTGIVNTGIGYGALAVLTSGSNNVAVGGGTLTGLITGEWNIAVGADSGVNYSSNESSNILIGNDGVAAEDHIMRLGTDGIADGEVDQCFIAGIWGRTPPVSSQVTFTADDGEMTTSGAALDGEVLIGRTLDAPVWNSLTAGANITITPGVGTITIASSGGTTTFDCDTGTASPAAGVITMAGGSNLSSTGDGASTVTFDLDDDVTISGTYTTTGGNIDLPATNAALTEGVLSWAGTRVLHTFNVSNLFLGVNAGNGTTSGTENIMVGEDVGQSLTSGIRNSSLGTGSGFNLTAGNQNVIVGYEAGRDITTGNLNTIVGYRSGLNYTGGESSNILIGNLGTASESNVCRIGIDGGGAGQVDDTYIAGIYQRTNTTTSEVTFTDTDGKMTTSTGTTGQVLVGRTGDSPLWSNLVAGTNITIDDTSSPGEIEISSTGGSASVTGTWTPVLSYPNQTIAPTYNISENRYVKIGDYLVHVSAEIEILTAGTAPGGDLLTFSNFPFSTNGLTQKFANAVWGGSQWASLIYLLGTTTTATASRTPNQGPFNNVTRNLVAAGQIYYICNTYLISP